MYKELESDIEGFKMPDHGYLIGWAKQGYPRPVYMYTYMYVILMLLIQEFSY